MDELPNRVCVVLSLALSFGIAGCFNPDESEVSATEAAEASSTSTSTSTSTSSDAEDSTTATSSTTTDEPTGAGPTTDDTTGPDPSTTGSDETTDSAECSLGERCLLPLPPDWTGPVALGGADQCPPAYPEVGGVLNADLEPGTYTCGCNCGVQSVSCVLFAEEVGEPFTPMMSCESPEAEDECLSAVVEASCSTNLVDVPAQPSWGESRQVCRGPVEGQSCEQGGTCFAAGPEGLCIARDGEHPCPAGYGVRTVYHRGFDDDRECSECTCNAEGQSCSIDVEICSIGFFDATLVSGDECLQLNSGDGDGVSFQGSNISSQGTCTAGAGTGEVQGQVVEVDPVTVCCQG